MSEIHSSNTVAAQKYNHEKKTSDDNGTDDDDDDANSCFSVTDAAIPWDRVAAFLPWSDVLSVRLTSKDMLWQWHDAISPEFCATQLAAMLESRNMYLCYNTDRWKSTTVRDAQTLVPRFFQRPQLAQYATAMDILFRVLRVMHAVPEETAVCFSGKYGRHCRPVSVENNTLRAYPPCHRKAQGCTTCRVKIPLQEEDDVRNDNAEEEDEDDDYDDHDSTPQHKLDDYYHIQKGPGQFLCLESYIPKCSPGLPSDMTCPVCNVTDKTTLQLTEVTYQSSPGTDRRKPFLMPLTLTPREEGSKEEKTADDTQFSPPMKRSRLEETPQHEDANDWIRPTDSSFPPIYRELFIPQSYRYLKPAEDCKTAVAIHCAGCRQFAVIAPANVCMNQDFPCAAKLIETDGKTVVGGVLTRTKCSWKDCSCAAVCRTCCAVTERRPGYSDGVQANRLRLGCSRCKRRPCWQHRWDAEFASRFCCPMRRAFSLQAAAL